VRGYTYYTDGANENVGRRNVLSHHVGDEVGSHADDSNETGYLQASGNDESHAKGTELRGRHIDDVWLVGLIYPEKQEAVRS
jgi:hypothetical protein